MSGGKWSAGLQAQVVFVISAVCWMSGLASAQFLVRDVKSASPYGTIFDKTFLPKVDDLLAGEGIGSQKTTFLPYLDLFDVDGNTGEGTGYFRNNQPFPNNQTRVNDQWFAVQAVGLVNITRPGLYLLATYSDDGVRVRLGDTISWDTIILDDEIHPPTENYEFIEFGSPGLYPLELTYFEATGHAVLEFYAALVTGDTVPRSSLRLVGDTANGGLEVLPPACGDLDLDIDLDSVDLLSMIEHWTGSLDSGTGRRTFLQGDCDFDEDIDSADLLNFLSEWTGSSSAGRLVPEPSSISLVAVASSVIAGMFALRRRERCATRRTWESP